MMLAKYVRFGWNELQKEKQNMIVSGYFVYLL
jgi:hypothetical protein